MKLKIGIPITIGRKLNEGILKLCALMFSWRTFFNPSCLKLFTGFALLSFYSLAQEPVFTASVDRNPVSIGESFTLSYELNANGGNFQPPPLNDFFVHGGPNRSTSVQFINGSMSQSLTLSYVLQPKAEGTFKIGQASIEVGGKKILSNAITLNVTKGSKPQSGNQQQQHQQQNAGVNPDDLFLKVSINKSNVYKGESLIATYKLYTRVNIVNYAINKVPSFTGFWSQDFPQKQQLELYNENVNGVNYKVGEIKKVILFPQQSGTLTLEPMEGEFIVRMQVKRNRNDPFSIFDDPFFGGGLRDVKYGSKSAPVKITVLDLPSPAPASFNGAVGKINFDAALDKNKVKANDPVTLKIKISGNGNLKLINPPSVEIPPDIEKYDPKINDNISVTSGGVSGSRSIEYLLIPRHEGRYELNPVAFSFFDLEKKAYVTRSSPAFVIHVEKGEGGSAAAVTAASKAEFQVLGTDIRYIKTSAKFLSAAGTNFFRTPLFYSLLVCPVLIFAGALIYAKRLEKLRGNVTLMKTMKATRMARKRLASAEKLLKANNKEKFYEEVSKALWGYVSDKLAIPPSELSRERVKQDLAGRNIKEASIDKLLAVIDHCEIARYAPTGNSMEAQSVYNSAVKNISSLENEIR